MGQVSQSTLVAHIGISIGLPHVTLRDFGKAPMRGWLIGLAVLSLLLALPVRAQSVVCPPQSFPPEPKPNLRERLTESSEELGLSKDAATPEPALREKVKTAYQKQQYGDAENLLRQFLQQQPQNGWALSDLADVLRRQGKRSEAKEMYDRAIQANRRNIQAYMGRAILGEPDAAEIDLLHSIDVMMVFNREIYVNTHKAFLQANPDYEEAYQWLGLALSHQLLATPNFGNLLENGIDPDYPTEVDPIVGAAKTFKPEQLQPIVAHYRQAYQRFPGNSDFFKILLESLEIQGKGNEVIHLYCEAIQRQPRSPYLRLGLGSVLFRAKQFDQAQTIFCQAKQLLQSPRSAGGELTNPSDYADAVKRLAKVLRAKKQFKQVSELYQAEIKAARTPQIAERLRYDLSVLLQEKGQK